MMTIEAIAPISALIEPGQAQAAATAQESTSTFGKWFAGEMTSVNDKLVGADQEIQQLAAGQVQNLHEVMIHLEEARLSFQLLMQVRNHALEAYQEVMRTQV
jgi:flagellar hook-basal body complex protein FliE